MTDWKMNISAPARRAHADTRARVPANLGFTLVELLVVIGIIALLISILLPSLNAARAQAQTIKCLSNLRQLGVAAAGYASQHKGMLLPADLDDKNYPVDKGHGRTWSETWATILVADGYLSYPTVTSETIPPGTDNVFHCPSGVMESSVITNTSNNVPATRKDAQGAMAYLNQSQRLQPGLNVFSWYGINGASSPTTPFPFRRVVIETSKKVSGYRKSNEVRNPTEMVFLFDGILGLNYAGTNANRINARHNNQKVTNIAFIDGHAESLPTKSLP
ncbi:MAG: hypothetical protein AVDCRST_MAG64-2988, partial [uncultured Phycisphaerae bacterium]